MNTNYEHCFRGHGGPLHKIQGTVGTKMSANADRITLETYSKLTTGFSYMDQNMNTNAFFYYLGGPGDLQ